MKGSPEERNYLVELDANLAGWLPEEMRACFVSEAAFYIERTARNQMLRGEPYEDAVQRAIEHQGSPRRVAEEYIQKYYEEQIPSPVYRKLGRANTSAVAVFGLANALYMAFLQYKLFFASSEPLRIGPVEARRYFPEPLPFPDLSWQFFVTVGYPLIAPWIAGWICGQLIPVGASSAVSRVLQVMIIGAFLLGVMLVPELDALLYAVLLTVYWLPVGSLSAHFSSSLLRSRKRRKAERTGAHPSLGSSILEVNP